MIMGGVNGQGNYFCLRRVLQFTGNGEGCLILLQGRGKQVFGDSMLSARHKGMDVIWTLPSTNSQLREEGGPDITAGKYN